jgi:hypothetical protein
VNGLVHRSAALLLALLWLPALATEADGASAADADTEIQYLLETTGQSDCSFIRNGKSHTATDAESHLRLKYSNGKRWVSTTEQFINRIASKSSWTGKKYYIDCPDKDRQASSDWMSARLTQYRDQ